MGIYDRDYYQEERRGFHFGGPRLMVTNLVLINVAVYLVEIFFFPHSQRFIELLGLQSNLLVHPWQIYQLITSGFVHDPDDVWHIIGNMAVLWFLGREVETIYGKRQFLEFYLSTLVLAGLCWAALENLIDPGSLFDPDKVKIAMGASGAVTAVAMVFVMHFPRRLLYVYFLIPVPIWLVAAVYLLYNALETVKHQGSIATSAHLAGAALGYLFYRTQWQLGRVLPNRWSWRSLRWPQSRPRIHRPADDDVREEREDDDEDALKAEVDRILEKISREGEASLSSRERRTLEDASRRYQQRGRQ